MPTGFQAMESSCFFLMKHVFHLQNSSSILNVCRSSQRTDNTEVLYLGSLSALACTSSEMKVLSLTQFRTQRKVVISGEWPQCQTIWQHEDVTELQSETNSRFRERPQSLSKDRFLLLFEISWKPHIWGEKGSKVFFKNSLPPCHVPQSWGPVGERGNGGQRQPASFAAEVSRAEGTLVFTPVGLSGVRTAYMAWWQLEGTLAC